MGIMIYRLSFVYSVFLLLFSCKNSIPPHNRFAFYPCLPDTTFVKNEFIYNRFRDYQTFNLSSLLKGTDSFELQDSISIKNNVWSGYHYHYYTLNIVDLFCEIDGLKHTDMHIR